MAQDRGHYAVQDRPTPRVHYTGLIASSIKRLINGWQHPAHTEFAGAIADQRQMNGAYGVHQMRVRLPDDPTVYRVLVLPAEAPVSIGGVPADQHFSEPMTP